ncbi:hypothetical protein [Brevibacterium litoralis]|uniref:hypothetical protein n=1 Tax=Brevibacterium litoralis TaxID=3138935 RepID=UPI0032EAC5BF
MAVLVAVLGVLAGLLVITWLGNRFVRQLAERSAQAPSGVRNRDRGSVTIGGSAGPDAVVATVGAPAPVRFTGRSWHYATDVDPDLFRTQIHRFILGEDEHFDGLEIIEETEQHIRYGLLGRPRSTFSRALGKLTGHLPRYDWEAVVVMPDERNHRVVFGFTDWHMDEGKERGQYAMRKIKYRVDATVRACDPAAFVTEKDATPILWM